MNAESWVDVLQLIPHPEGGFFRETFRDTRQHAGRSVCTAIFFLLPKGAVSHLHRIDASEVWHFHAGGALEIVEINEDGTVETTTLGADVRKGEVLQHVVQPGRWFGAALAPDTEYALVGCTVAPGFLFEHFEMASRKDLQEKYPGAREWIERLTDE
jgi:predicted cupin superfamily sugar epimerase